MYVGEYIGLPIKCGLFGASTEQVCGVSYMAVNKLFIVYTTVVAEKSEGCLLRN